MLKNYAAYCSPLADGHVLFIYTTSHFLNLKALWMSSAWILTVLRHLSQFIESFILLLLCFAFFLFFALLLMGHFFRSRHSPLLGQISKVVTTVRTVCRIGFRLFAFFFRSDQMKADFKGGYNCDNYSWNRFKIVRLFPSDQIRQKHRSMQLTLELLSRGVMALMWSRTWSKVELGLSMYIVGVGMRWEIHWIADSWI